MSMKVGDLIGDYEVLEILGTGGMGEVYKVRNTISNRVEAAKVLLPDLAGNPALADRFTREIRVLAGLDHPNIAKLHTAQRVNNQLLMIMEYVEGTTLEQLLERGRVPVADAVRHFDQVLSALAYAHERGVVHRDIKPANMMLTPSGVIKLMDFGIAKAATDQRLTQTGFTLGSLYYMSPEQIRGDTTLDARSDIYSLGISLYELVTGKRPFEGDSQYSVMAAHLQQAPVPPVQLDPALPETLNDVILMAIAKEPEKRFQTAAAFQRALAAAGGGAGMSAAVAQAGSSPTRSARQPEPWEQPRPVQAGNSRVLYLLAGSAATIALLVFAVIEIPRWRSTRAGEAQPPPAAVQETTPAVVLPETAAPPAEPDIGTIAAPEEPVVPVSRQPTAPAREATPRRQPATAATTAAPPAAVTALPPGQQPPEEPPAPARQQPTAPVTTSTGSVAPPAAPPPGEAALREMREQLMLMATRVGAVRNSIATLRRSQEASGLGLRGDIAAGEQRLTYYLDEAEAALAERDAEAAKNYLSQAERQLRTLEKFLGR